jgi:hypothetical protein
VVLGVESSCDDTAAAVVRGDGTVLAHKIASQVGRGHGGGIRGEEGLGGGVRREERRYIRMDEEGVHLTRVRRSSKGDKEAPNKGVREGGKWEID